MASKSWFERSNDQVDQTFQWITFSAVDSALDHASSTLGNQSCGRILSLGIPIDLNLNFLLFQNYRDQLIDSCHH